MSETLNGAELSHLLLGRGTTATEIAAMDLEALTQKVAYRRKKKVAPEAVDPAMTDEQIARAILDYARSEPTDWPVAPLPGVGTRLLPAMLGALGGAAAGFGAPYLFQDSLSGPKDGQEYYFVACLLGPLCAAIGAFVGMFAGSTRVVARTWQRALMGLAAGLIVGIALVVLVPPLFLW